MNRVLDVIRHDNPHLKQVPGLIGPNQHHEAGTTISARTSK